jgi:hypothetical protein
LLKKTHPELWADILNFANQDYSFHQLCTDTNIPKRIGDLPEYSDNWPQPSEICKLEYFSYADHVMIYIVSSLLGLCFLVLLLKVLKQSRGEDRHKK